MNSAKKPKVAIIGGGIFGTTCAMVMGEKFHVTIFEKNSDIHSEATFVNQYRHHFGFHYPRSPETIHEIQESAHDFEDFYKSIIVKNFPAYYCIAKKDSKVSGNDFLKICNDFHLPYEFKFPRQEFLNRQSVEICIKTPESIYDYYALKDFTKKKLQGLKNIIIRYDYKVVDVCLDNSGQKLIIADSRGQIIKESFDYVINATYAHYNEFCKWMGFPSRDLEFRFKELVVIKMSLKDPCAVTIMDGPFATIVPIAGKKNYYTFGDVPLSVHKIFKKLDFFPENDAYLKKPKTRWIEMRKRCLPWFPFLKDARYVESRFVILPIEAESENTDSRPTDIVSHGKGCFSILSGKIITCVSSAKKIHKEILHYAGQ